MHNLYEKFDAILFDWDGVILDSTLHSAMVCVEVCKRYGVVITPEHYLENFSQPHWIYYESVGVKCETPEERARLEDLYWQVLEESPVEKSLFPEAENALKQLSNKTFILGIISASKRHLITDMLALGLNEIFDDENIISDVINKVQSIKDFYERNRVDPKRVLMIGDLPSDLIDGRDAGVKVAGLARNTKQRERLASYKPDYLFDDLTQLL